MPRPSAKMSYPSERNDKQTMTRHGRVVLEFVAVESANRPGEASPGTESTDAFRLNNQRDADRLGGDFDLGFDRLPVRRALLICPAHSAVHIGNDFVRVIGFDFVGVL